MCKKDLRATTQIRLAVSLQFEFTESEGRFGECELKAPDYFFFFFTCMFYQLLGVQHSCSSTQSWGSVLPSIVETRDQNSRGCPLLFSNRNLGSFCA